MSLTTIHGIISPDKAPTIQGFINLKESDDMTYSKFALYHKCESQPNLMIALSNVLLSDYWDELKKDRQLVVLNDLEYIKYRYRAKLFSKDLYGTTQLYFVILALNNMYNMKDFNKKRIWALYPSNMFKLLNEVYSAESVYINKNKNE